MNRSTWAQPGRSRAQHEEQPGLGSPVVSLGWTQDLGQDGQYLALSSQGVLPGSAQASPEIKGQASSSNLIIEGLLREAAKGYTALTNWNLWENHFCYRTCCQQLPEVGLSWGGLKLILHPHRGWLELPSPEAQHCTWHRSTGILLSQQGHRAAAPPLSIFRLCSH